MAAHGMEKLTMAYKTKSSDGSMRWIAAEHRPAQQRNRTAQEVQEIAMSEEQEVPVQEAVRVEEDVEMEVDGEGSIEDEPDKEKIKLLPQATSEDGRCASFQILEEDHTLGNALRYIIMKNPDVEFCGYSIPHPSENLLNVRIQTYGESTAVEVLHKGLQDLMDLCDAVEEKFTQRIREL